MARPPRLEFPGAVYHVTARGNERRSVFRDDRDREEYLARVARYRERFRFEVLAYCLMTNHVHLALRCGPIPLSRIMAGLHSTYTQWFNCRHRRVGHLFQGRYKAFLVQEDRYLVALIRYIHRNPVEAKLVARASDYPWSSDRFLRHGRAPDWFDLHAVLPSFGLTPRVAVRAYIDLVDGETGLPSYVDLHAVDQIIKGDELFALERFEAAGQLDPPLRGLSDSAVVEAVMRVTGIDPDDTARGAAKASVAFVRSLAAYIGKQLGRISTRRFTRRFHLDDSSLVRPLAALEKTLQTDRALSDQIDRIVREIRQQGGATSPQRSDPLAKSANQD
ncbi:MAG: transposase [Acidobacteriota bacterium]